MTHRESSSEFKARWTSWLLARNRRSTRAVLWINVILYPLFGVLDYLVIPSAWLWLLFATRGVVTAATFLMWAALPREVFARHMSCLTSVYILLSSFGISLMTVFFGGLASTYYAGLILVIIGSGLLFVWKPRVAIITHTLIVLSFVLPNFVLISLHHQHITVAAVSNLFFLISTALIVCTGQIVSYRGHRAEVERQLILEQTKQNLEQAYGKLQHLDRQKSQFFANITHELKTPLAMILTPLDLLLQGDMGELSEMQRTTLQSMFRSSLKLLKMINDLLDLSKLEEEQLRLQIAPHDLLASLRSLLSQVGVLAQRKRIELRLRSSVDSAVVHCDLERMERVFLNLLSNATKFTPEGGHIDVEISATEQEIRITVKDDGPGFPQEQAAAVFERFVQLDAGRKRKYGGTGIGLALAKELVNLHGGRIWAESAPGKGASFTVELQKGTEHFDDERVYHAAEISQSSVTPTALGSKDWSLQLTARDDFKLLDISEATALRVVDADVDEVQCNDSILVVEDNPDVIGVIQSVLRHHFRIISASNGRAGLELATRERPSLIITDLMMPELDGLELTRRLREDARTRQIPIIMLTARADLDDRLQGLESGVNAYLAKPFAARELLTTVRSLLSLQETATDAMLTQRMDSLQTITAGLAHEINNPLNYMKAALACVRRDLRVLVPSGSPPASSTPSSSGESAPAKLEARLDKMLSTAESGLQRIAGTVDLLRRYSREGFARIIQSYDVFAASRGVVDLVLPATGRAVEVSYDFEGDGHAPCVPEEINQVLTNLIQNAIEAAPEQTGRVNVRGWSSEGKVFLAVADNGPGISHADQDKIFTPFFTTKGPERGMGLGLAISWQVVRRMGGTISVNSQPGQGAEFVVHLPQGQTAGADPRSTACQAALSAPASM